MEIQTDFDKMQFLFTGNRFTGVELTKTKFNLYPDATSLTISMAVIVDFLEVGDQAKYIHNATLQMDSAFYTNQSLSQLKHIVSQAIAQLISRYNASYIVKTLKLSPPDGMPDKDLDQILLKILSDLRP